MDDLDVLLLRNDPSADLTQRAWAQTAGIVFGRVAMRHGVIVLNDPNGLSQAMNKMYFQLFPREDMRSNIHAGGTLKSAVVTEEHLCLAEIVRPKVVQDGMFLVGLDIVGDKLMEINVFSPGGLGSAQKFERVNFAHAVIEAVERKVDYMTFSRRNFDNAEMASL